MPVGPLNPSILFHACTEGITNVAFFLLSTKPFNNVPLIHTQIYEPINQDEDIQRRGTRFVKKDHSRQGGVIAKLSVVRSGKHVLSTEKSLI